eukprot:1182825-Prorocentrum_minimum.AAC.2
MLYMYLGEWNPRLRDMSEVYNLMYPAASHLKSKGALIRLFFYYDYLGRKWRRRSASRGARWRASWRRRRRWWRAPWTRWRRRRRGRGWPTFSTCCGSCRVKSLRRPPPLRGPATASRPHGCGTSATSSGACTRRSNGARWSHNP